MIGAATAAAGAVKVLGSALSSFDPVKDQHRIDTNNRAFALANSTTGDRNAFLFLRQRSGKFGTMILPAIADVTSGGAIGGWADNGNADEDAYSKYKQLLPRYTAAQATGTGDPLPGEIVDPTNVDKEPNHEVLGVSRTPTMAGSGMLIALLVGLVVVAAISGKSHSPAA